MEQSPLKFRNGIKDGLPIGLGYLSVAFAFGVRASLLGLPALFSTLISMTNLTSAGQLAGIKIIAALGSVAEIMLVQLVINSRYFLMGVSLSQKADCSFTTGKRLIAAAFITDEIFAVSVSKRQKINFKYFIGLAVLPYIGWTLGTVIGAFAGDVLPATVQAALGIALYAMFVAIIFPPAVRAFNILFTVSLAALLSCACYYIPFINNNLSQGFAIIICAVISAAAAAAIFPVKEDYDE
ncbi:MAG: AzlC family ABC transporter permease [Clostridia bacterium]|nr:AzlC family ABC transporter permease [Clostridia bacterium]